ncbi:SPW repeat protein [Kibdelosporangium persicum]|uniref:SPW repeat-containing integral membrane domain-containing protein n=1 Tax=Kibdelosporangium persicum TaxID=2698649 RepID=A0ABX2FGW0_9PSEU|nr:SPW repeat protein [Kibdelosporangium persicum]NRN70631.1 hypothetical protein [Kibdelosporangium persicum]
MSAATHRQGFQPPGRRYLPGAGLVMAAGVWLVIVSASWTYGDVDSWLDARWNDAAAGSVLAVVGMVRIVRPVLTNAARLLSILVGSWLIIAPFVVGYGFGADSTPATANDVLIGAVITGMAVFGRI